MKKTNLLLLFILLFGFVSQSNAQIKVKKEKLIKIPESIANTLIGIRSYSGNVFAVGMNGNFIRHDLTTGETIRGEAGSEKVIDFDVILDQLIYLDGESKPSGKIRLSWPKKSFEAASIDAVGEGIILTGGSKAIYLSKIATKAVEIPNLKFVLPVKNDYLWSISRTGIVPAWHINLYDCYGNFMKEVYKFSSEFHPAGLNLGPVGPEGEALLSFYSGAQREIVLIGQNGHMFWRIQGPAQFCKRDIAFDTKGNLIVVEVEGKDVYLYRWTFDVPQG